MDIHQATDIARSYLYETYIFNITKPIEAYSLNRELNYLLCKAFDRMAKACGKFGGVTPHDIIILVESWIIAQGTGRPKVPLEINPLTK